jgi:hypothetical protein
MRSRVASAALCRVATARPLRTGRIGPEGEPGHAGRDHRYGDRVAARHPDGGIEHVRALILQRVPDSLGQNAGRGPVLQGIERGGQIVAASVDIALDLVGAFSAHVSHCC